METETEAQARPSAWSLPALMLGLALVLLAAFPYFEQVRNANEVPRLLQAMALAEQGEWAIDGPSRRGIALGPDVARSPVDGRLYPNKPPGASVVAVAALGLARATSESPTLRSLTWWARLLAGVVPALLIAALGWRRLAPRYGAWIALAAVSGVLLGTPLFAYARLFYGHALAACLLYMGLRGIELSHERDSLLPLAGGALAAAAAITVEYGAAFAGLPIALLLLAPLLSRTVTPSSRKVALTRAVVGLACALLPVALLAVYQRDVFGSPWATGYHHAADPGFAELHGQGLLGLGAPRLANVRTHWLSPNTGLLAWSPLVLVGLAGLVRLSLREGPDRLAARLELAVFATIALMGLGLSFEGGWRVGPRYLVLVLPALMLGLAESLAWLRERPAGLTMALGIGVLTCLWTWSLLANALAATFWPHLDPTNIAEPFGAVLLPLWRGGFAPYGLPRAFPGGASVAMLLPLGLGLVGLCLALGPKQRGEEIVLPGSLGLIAGMLMVGMVIPECVEAHPKTERNLKYIERVYEPTQTRPQSDRGRVDSGTQRPAPSVELGAT